MRAGVLIQEEGFDQWSLD